MSLQNSGGIKIKVDYVPKVKKGSGVSSKQSRPITQVCPRCKRPIPVNEMDEHVRIELLDPKWRQQRDKAASNLASSNLLSGSVIAENLKRISTFRTDIFEGDEEKLAKKVLELKKLEQEREDKIWDGHTATATSVQQRAFISGLQDIHRTGSLLGQSTIDPALNIGPAVPAIPQLDASAVGAQFYGYDTPAAGSAPYAYSYQYPVAAGFGAVPPLMSPVAPAPFVAANPAFNVVPPVIPAAPGTVPAIIPAESIPTPLPPPPLPPPPSLPINALKRQASPDNTEEAPATKLSRTEPATSKAGGTQPPPPPPRRPPPPPPPRTNSGAVAPPPAPARTLSSSNAVVAVPPVMPAVIPALPVPLVVPPVVQITRIAKAEPTLPGFIPEEHFLAFAMAPISLTVRVAQSLLDRLKDEPNLGWKFPPPTISQAGVVIVVPGVAPTMLVSAIKEKLASVTGMPSSKQKLTLQERVRTAKQVLKDGLFSAYYNLSAGDIVELSLRERGGKK